MIKFKNFLLPYAPEIVWERVSVINDLFSCLSISNNTNLNTYRLEVNNFILSKIQPHLLNSKTKKFYHSEDDIPTLKYIKGAIDSVSNLQELNWHPTLPYLSILVGTEYEQYFVNHSNKFEPSCQGAFNAQVSKLNIILSKITALQIISFLTWIQSESYSKLISNLFSEKQQVIGRILFYGNLLGGEYQKQAMDIAIKQFTGGVQDNRPYFHMMSDLSNTGQTPGSYLSSDADSFYTDIVTRIKNE